MFWFFHFVTAHWVFILSCLGNIIKWCVFLLNWTYLWLISATSDSTQDFSIQTFSVYQHHLWAVEIIVRVNYKLLFTQSLHISLYKVGVLWDTADFCPKMGPVSPPSNTVNTKRLLFWCPVMMVKHFEVCLQKMDFWPSSRMGTYRKIEVIQSCSGCDPIESGPSDPKKRGCFFLAPKNCSSGQKLIFYMEPPQRWSYPNCSFLFRVTPVFVRVPVRRAKKSSPTPLWAVGTPSASKQP